MKQGKVCETHQEFAPDGQCRWCEPKTLLDLPHTGITVDDYGAGGGPLEALRVLWIASPSMIPGPIADSHYIACLSFSGAACNCDSLAARFSKSTP